ncbi:MAG: hypothetical protein QOF42_3689 [Gammaproteobacteria bacterium]|jgi:hypothetical protein|nr:hypothetical protein [Gammaproteobacteria bacterium]
MKAMEYLRAAGLAFVILVIDVVLAVAVVYAWGRFWHPGRPQSFYETAGVPIARLSTRIIGTTLIFLAAWLAARQRPQRPAYLFALALVFFYVLLDGASVAFEHFFNLSLALTVSLKLLAALAGAALAVKQRTARPTDTSIG